jgi:hypothetical protein
MFVLVFLFCVVCISRGLCDGLITRPKECCCLNRLRNIPCEAAKVNTTTVEPLMDGWMIMIDGIKEYQYKWIKLCSPNVKRFQLQTSRKV